MNVFVVNCGSSSLKYQLIDSVSEQVIAKGLCERIGIDGRLTHKPTGKKEVVKVTISEEAVDPDDIETLQDMIVAATNEALRQAEEANSALMGKMAGGLGLGGGFPF